MKKKIVMGIGICFVLFVIVGAFSEDQTETEQVEATPKTETKDEVKQEEPKEKEVVV